MTPVRLFLCGDVMIGRGVDQILPHPCDPRLQESYVASAEVYVRLAEQANGPIPRPLPLSYVWGDALEELARMRADLRIINLETSVTRDGQFFPKGINYRVSPENAACLKAAGVDCCALANNHVLDFGRAGLLDTLDHLARLGVKTAGAGRNRAEAFAPAIFALPVCRVLVYSCASTTSGVPESWAARAQTAGVALLPSSAEKSVALVAEAIARERRDRDIIVLSLHLGPNWGYEICEDDRDFTHRLIDEAGVSILHCHSSHHPKAIEVFRDRLILHGCGDFLDDYEGIAGREEFRGDLTLMYFADVDPAQGELIALAMTPLQIRRLRLNRPCDADVEWLRRTLDRESRRLGAAVSLRPDGRLALCWRGSFDAPSRDGPI
jgi:poly-gamma-glutamate capsule biosynthesis protein CapA/YwtB (metallophosphatase superfamily)